MLLLLVAKNDVLVVLGVDVSKLTELNIEYHDKENKLKNNIELLCNYYGKGMVYLPVTIKVLRSLGILLLPRNVVGSIPPYQQLSVGD